MTPMLRRLTVLLLLSAAGCNLGSTEGMATVPPPVTPDPTVVTQMAAEPTPARFDVDPNDLAAAQVSPAASGDTTDEPTDTVAAGEFRLRVSGDTRLTFDSAGTPARATFVDQGETAFLRFRLGADANSLFAQEIDIALPSAIAPGVYLLQGNLGLGALTGDDAGGVPMQGQVTVEAVTAESISGTFEFTAETGGSQPTVVSGRFNQIPRVTE